MDSFRLRGRSISRAPGSLGKEIGLGDFRLTPACVPQSFRERVAAELLAVQNEQGPRLGPLIKSARRKAGLCVGCGGLVDDRTPGCLNCKVRHSVRRYDARERSKRP